MSRFPRTASDFAANNRRVAVQCGHCNTTRFESPETIVLTFGPDFDLYSGLKELQAQLYCAGCGQGHPSVYFVDTTPRDHFRSVPFEEAVSHIMEFNAFVEARDEGKRQPVKGPKRRRR